MNRDGVRVTFDSGNVIPTKGGEFLGKGFCNGGLSVLDLATENKMNAYVAYIVKFVSLWHARLGRVNIAFIKKS